MRKPQKKREHENKKQKNEKKEKVAVGLAVPEGIGSLKQAVLISSPLTLEQARTRSPLVVAVRQGLGLPVRTVVTPVQ